MWNEHESNRWQEVAKLQAAAYRRLAILKFQYDDIDTMDVEDTIQWKMARSLANQLLNAKAAKRAALENDPGIWEKHINEQ